MIDKKIKLLKKELNDSPDIIYRKVKIKGKEILLVFNTSTSKGSDINDFILKKLTNLKKRITKKNIYHHLENILPENVIKNVENKEDLFTKLNAGFTIIIFEKEKPIAIETKKDLSRGISEPQTEQSISGPKDAFTENYETNLGLIRKRIKTNELTIKEKNIGKQTKTKIAIIYMNNIAKTKLVEQIEKKIDKINIDGILDSTIIRECIEDKHTIFPSIITTERPDTSALSLLDGKICVMIENSPYLLIIPTFFTDLFHASEDNYQSHINVTFTRIIRYFSFLIAIALPGFYIAITTYNHETIPITLLANFAAQTKGVPFPEPVEALGLTLVFEILRESDIRMPHIAGTAISILGAIVLGDAAVSAGIVSPIMVIIISLSAIASLMFSQIGMVNAIRIWKIIFMILASIAGIVGLFIAVILLTINLSSMTSLNIPYLYPVIPFNKKFIKNVILKEKIENDNKRMNILTEKNKTRSKL